MVLKIDADGILEIVSEILLNNGVAVLPCDTIYGFVSLPGEAEERIKFIKGRDAGKHFLKLIKPEYLSSLTDYKPDKKLISYWPGPLTLIVPGKKGGSEGVRVPDNRFLLEILDKVGGPIISTSVNRSGGAPLNDISEIIAAFEDKTDLIVDGGELPYSLPSTILDVTSVPFKIVRRGDLIPDLF